MDWKKAELCSHAKRQTEATYLKAKEPLTIDFTTIRYFQINNISHIPVCILSSLFFQILKLLG